MIRERVGVMAFMLAITLMISNTIVSTAKSEYPVNTETEVATEYNVKEWLEAEYNGGFYLHDAPSATFLPYCYAYDLTRLATEGLFFLKNYNNQPPRLVKK